MVKFRKFVIFCILFLLIIIGFVSATTTRYIDNVAEIRDGEVSYKINDRLGSQRVIVDEGGEVTAEFKSLPYGQVIDDGLKYGFTGKEKDVSTGLHYFSARYYDSSTGRFAGVDPVKDNHPYSYVSNNPMNYVDPTGMIAQLYSNDIEADKEYSEDEKITYYNYASENDAKKMSRLIETRTKFENNLKTNDNAVDREFLKMAIPYINTQMSLIKSRAKETFSKELTSAATISGKYVGVDYKARKNLYAVTLGEVVLSETEIDINAHSDGKGNFVMPFGENSEVHKTQEGKVENNRFRNFIYPLSDVTSFFVTLINDRKKDYNTKHGTNFENIDTVIISSCKVDANTAQEISDNTKSTVIHSTTGVYQSGNNRYGLWSNKLPGD